MKKSLVLSVSVQTGCYRHIQINESATLLKLHFTILEAFGFDDDHLHAFFMNNSAWDEDAEYVSPHMELEGARGFSDRAKLSKFHLVKGDKFLYIFDFGDEWRFQIRVLRVVDELVKTPAVLKSKGQVSQYGDNEEDGDEDEDGDDF
jgi:hypothetical protein